MGSENTKLKRGGKRPFSGAPKKYGEPTTTVAFRVPVSKVKDIKSLIQSKLQDYERKTKGNRTV
jgi:hypothetical protein